MDDLLAQNRELSLGLELLSTGSLHRLACDRTMRQARISLSLAWPLLLIKHRGGNLRQRALAALVGADPASMGRTIDRLVAMGMVERADDPNDRRAWKIILTPAGQAFGTRIEGILSALHEELLADANENEIQAFMRVSGLIRKRLSKDRWPGLQDVRLLSGA
jgi:MarR family transcriptional regulator, transcriptional regulator for hemolysin